MICKYKMYSCKWCFHWSYFLDEQQVEFTDQTSGVRLKNVLKSIGTEPNKINNNVMELASWKVLKHCMHIDNKSSATNKAH